MRKLNLGWGAPLLLSLFVAMPLAAQARNLNGCGPSGNRPSKCQVQVQAPEIDVGGGLAALAVILAGLALAYERRRDA